MAYWSAVTTLGYLPNRSRRKPLCAYVNTRHSQNPVHALHSLGDIFSPNFAGYFYEFSTLVSVGKSDKKARLRRPGEQSLWAARFFGAAHHHLNNAAPKTVQTA